MVRAPSSGGREESSSLRSLGRRRKMMRGPFVFLHASLYQRAHSRYSGERVSLLGHGGMMTPRRETVPASAARLEALRRTFQMRRSALRFGWRGTKRMKSFLVSCSERHRANSSMGALREGEKHQSQELHATYTLYTQPSTYRPAGHHRGQ